MKQVCQGKALQVRGSEESQPLAKPQRVSWNITTARKEWVTYLVDPGNWSPQWT